MAAMSTTFAAWIERLADAASRPADPESERLRKATLLLFAGLTAPAGILWGLIYLLLGQKVPALIPVAYTLGVLVSAAHFLVTRQYAVFRFMTLTLILVLPFVLQWTLGGFVASGAVLLWSALAPMGAVLVCGPARAWSWLLGFVAVTVLSGALELSAGGQDLPLSTMSGSVLPSRIVVLFFVLNVVTVCTLMLLLLRYFVAARDRAEARLAEALQQVRAEQETAERLLLNVLPKPIADRLREESALLADGFDEVTVLFADIVNFTVLSARMPPQELVHLLNRLFSAFDDLADRHGLEKIKTIGDAYMAAGGLPTHCSNHAEASAELALGMRDEVARFARELGEPLQVRIGLNTGPVVAGVIGRKKFIYDLWGDTVNMASRMESHGPAGTIQVTEATFQRLRSAYRFHARGEIDVKGKGLTSAYLLIGRRDDLNRPPGYRLGLDRIPNQ